MAVSSRCPASYGEGNFDDISWTCEGLALQVNKSLGALDSSDAAGGRDGWNISAIGPIAAVEMGGRPQSLDGPLVGVSAIGKALLPVFLVLSGANKGDRWALLEDEGTQEMLDGGTSSTPGSDATFCRGKRGRPP